MSIPTLPRIEFMVKDSYPHVHMYSNDNLRSAAHIVWRHGPGFVESLNEYAVQLEKNGHKSEAVKVRGIVESLGNL